MCAITFLSNIASHSLLLWSDMNEFQIYYYNIILYSSIFSFRGLRSALAQNGVLMAIMFSDQLQLTLLTGILPF